MYDTISPNRILLGLLNYCISDGVVTLSEAVGAVGAELLRIAPT